MRPGVPPAKHAGKEDFASNAFIFKMQFGDPEEAPKFNTQNPFYFFSLGHYTSPNDAEFQKTLLAAFYTQYLIWNPNNYPENFQEAAQNIRNRVAEAFWVLYNKAAHDEYVKIMNEDLEPDSAKAFAAALKKLPRTKNPDLILEEPVIVKEIEKAMDEFGQMKRVVEEKKIFTGSVREQAAAREAAARAAGQGAGAGAPKAPAKAVVPAKRAVPAVELKIAAEPKAPAKVTVPAKAAVQQPVAQPAQPKQAAPAQQEAPKTPGVAPKAPAKVAVPAKAAEPKAPAKVTAPAKFAAPKAPAKAVAQQPVIPVTQPTGADEAAAILRELYGSNEAPKAPAAPAKVTVPAAQAPTGQVALPVAEPKQPARRVSFAPEPEVKIMAQQPYDDENEDEAEESEPVATQEPEEEGEEEVAPEEPAIPAQTAAERKAAEDKAVADLKAKEAKDKAEIARLVQDVMGEEAEDVDVTLQLILLQNQLIELYCAIKK